MIKKKKRYTYTHIVFVTFILIFKFIFIYLLHVLLVFKIKDICENKVQPKSVLKWIVSFIYSTYNNL